MKICWDNLEKLIWANGQWKQQTKGGYWRYYIYKENCKTCNEPYLACKIKHENRLFCDKSCRMKWQYSVGKVPKLTAEKNGMYGRPHTQESIEKMRRNRRGKCKGKDNHRYVDGRSGLIKQIRSSGLNLSWRQEVWKRDDYTCQKCNKKGSIEINAHHIKPFVDIIREYNIKTLEEAKTCQELWNIDNGITYCKDCHKEEHNTDI